MKFRKGMHGKFTQTNTEYVLEFSSELPSFDNQLRHAKSQRMEEKSSVSPSEIFQGFQTIRNVEKDQGIIDLETPNFDILAENMTINETRTEDELKLAKEKLEKMLSTSVNNTKDEAIANPLQDCVFGSKFCLPHTTTVKKCRTSLWELFQKNKTGDEKTEPKSNVRNQTEKKTVNSVKTMLKKKITTTSADEKLHKILRMCMLHRINPECSAISQKSQNLWKHVTNSNYDPYRAIPETSANHTKSKVSNPVCGDTNWKREYWIKSDAEYLILEL